MDRLQRRKATLGYWMAALGRRMDRAEARGLYPSELYSVLLHSLCDAFLVGRNDLAEVFGVHAGRESR